jgi:hypothetical protein
MPFDSFQDEENEQVNGGMAGDALFLCPGMTDTANV